MSIKVECAVSVSEVDGTDVSLNSEQLKLIVRSHWNRDELVVVWIGGQEYTVTGRDLIVAIENAMRSNR